jgi:hypothetical protein
VAFLAGQVRPTPGPEPARVAERLAELNSGDFKRRDRAQRDLEKWGAAVEFDLRQALRNEPPLEVRRRLHSLLAKTGAAAPSGEALRTQRAVGVLDAIGSGAAQEVLQKLARGASGARVTVAAKAALQRLQR